VVDLEVVVLEVFNLQVVDWAVQQIHQLVNLHTGECNKLNIPLSTNRELPGSNEFIARHTRS